MSEDIKTDLVALKADVAALKLDVALLKQEFYYMKDGIKNTHNIFRWAFALALGGVITAVVNFVVAGGLTP